MPVETLRHITETPVFKPATPVELVYYDTPIISPVITNVLQSGVEQVQDALRKTAFKAKVAEVSSVSLSAVDHKSWPLKSSERLYRKVRRGGRSRKCHCGRRKEGFGHKCTSMFPLNKAA